MFIENTKDILYIVIAISVLWLTIFACWFIYYLIMIVRNMNRTVEEAREKILLFERLMGAAREKLEKSSSYLFIIAEAVKQGVGYLVSRRAESHEQEHKREGKKR